VFCKSCGSALEDAQAFCAGCGVAVSAAVETPAKVSDDNTLGLLSHLGGIFFGFIPSLVIYLIKQDSQDTVRDNAKEALNWQITVVLATLASIPFMFVVIGFVFFWAVLIVNFVFCIIGAVKSSSGVVYKYPIALKLIK